MKVLRRRTSSLRHLQQGHSSVSSPSPSVQVHFVTERKGSNPGGKCIIRFSHSEEFEGYFKYCPGSKLPRTMADEERGVYEQPFRSSHQPLYEAVTFILAKQLGLRVPEFYVLCNGNGITFTYDSDLRSRINEHMPYYFVSRLMAVPPPLHMDDSQTVKALAHDKIYRDLLMISDISHKAHNYRYDPESDTMIYLDLGCSFVHAVGGFLIPSHGKSVSRDKTNLRKSRNLSVSKAIERADAVDYVPLERIVDGFPDFGVPILNPSGTRSLYHFLSDEEKMEIQRMMQLNLLKISKKYGSDPRLVDY
ncbi:hypothetical protein J4421_02410 [Candidatus Woesearchaeota archaeon]|nr:hypothetical protein [Candidatus Woesearchaeota archaeon]